MLLCIKYSSKAPYPLGKSQPVPQPHPIQALPARVKPNGATFGKPRPYLPFSAHDVYLYLAVTVRHMLLIIDNQSICTQGSLPFIHLITAEKKFLLKKLKAQRQFASL